MDLSLTVFIIQDNGTQIYPISDGARESRERKKNHYIFIEILFILPPTMCTLD